VHFGDFSIGCSGVVLREREAVGPFEALLMQRGHEPFAGSWQLPGGYAEHDEPLSTAVEREVLEETGIVASVRDVLAFRHMVGGQSTNIYMIFRLDYVSGEPVFDGDETSDAGFFTLDQMAGMEKVQTISRWGIEQALVTEPGHGLSMDHQAPGAERPGWQLFGLRDIDPSVWRG